MRMQINTKAPYYQRKVQCPANFLLTPAGLKEDVWLREEVPLLKRVSKDLIKRYNLKTTRIARDRMGNKMLDGKKLYRLRKEGKLLQPFITASHAIEKVFDPMSPICKQCRGRCLEGKGKILTKTIKRLSGG